MDLKLENTIENLYNRIKYISIIIINLIVDNGLDFINFMLTNKIAQLSLGILLGTQISTLISSINNNFITPLLESISPYVSFNISNWKYNIAGIDFKIGLLFGSIFQFMFVIFLIYTSLEISKRFKCC